MERQCLEDAMAELVEAIMVQGEVASQRQILERGRSVFSQLLHVWIRLQHDETLAYEDKVAAQVRVLEGMLSSLWQLHKTLGRTLHLLHRHQQHLAQLQGQSDTQP